MLRKLLNVKFTPFSRRVPPKPPAKAQPKPEETTTSTLKIVHAGGRVECYYMAIPAIRIMDKYPSFILARPEVFKRPWDSIVRPDQILTPGEKFYVVPRHTIKKLRRRIRKPDREVSTSFVSQSSIDASVDMVSRPKYNVSRKSFLQQGDISDSSEVSGSFTNASKKKSAMKKHVRFVGIEIKKMASPCKKEKMASSCTKEKETKERNSRKSSNTQSQGQGGKRRPRNSGTWQPSLTVISERNDEMNHHI